MKKTGSSFLLPRISNFFKKRIRLLRIEHLIASHDRHQILCVRKIDDVVRPAWDHVNCFDLIPAYFEFNHLSGVNITLLNQAVTVNDNKLLPFGVVPMLTFGDAGFGDIDAGFPPIVLRTLSWAHYLTPSATLSKVIHQNIIVHPLPIIAPKLIPF